MYAWYLELRVVTSRHRECRKKKEQVYSNEDEIVHAQHLERLQ